MRLTHQSRRPPVPGLHMAAMIDVVFLLLIFFMCTSSFRKPEEDLPTQLPRVVGQQGATQEDFPPTRITLRTIGGGVLVECDGQSCPTFDALQEQIRMRRQAVGEISVIVEGQADVPFRWMVGAVDACYAANVYRVAFSARGQKP